MAHCTGLFTVLTLNSWIGELMVSFFDVTNRLIVWICSWKRKRIFYWSKTVFFFSLPVEKEIISNIKNSRLVKLSDEFVINKQTIDSSSSAIKIFYYFFRHYDTVQIKPKWNQTVFEFEKFPFKINRVFPKYQSSVQKPPYN